MAQLPTIFKKAEETFVKMERRPFDRFALGPFMIWYGLKSKKMPTLARRMIVAGGMYQIMFAWKEYQRLIGAVKTSPTEFFQVLKSETPPSEIEV